MTRFNAPIAEQIWDSKYRFKEADGTPIDNTVEDTWDRIANALAEAEADPRNYASKFKHALEDFKFLPAGRITAGAGTGRSVTLFNCFVMGTVPDSMGGIFDMLKEAALTMQQGGGIGYDFSTLRPKGSLVEGVAADASGPLTFMDVWDAMCRTVMSAGSRRGAMMATMRCDHPDVLDFIHAKKDKNRLRMFNLSVLVTDEFMDAVNNDLKWDLKFTDKHGVTKVYDTVNARDIWDEMMTSTYNQAEPGVIFIDRINNDNNLQYCETISATNPCGEQPLPPYGACLLGSINVAKFVKNPFTPKAKIDTYALTETVGHAVRMMDNVVDVSKFPLEAQRLEAEAKRRIGLGLTGLADALIMLRSVYGSDNAQMHTDMIMQTITYAAYQTSVELAQQKGAFPLFDADSFLNSGFMKRMNDNIVDNGHLIASIRKYGIRNALLTSIAPTGTISLYAGNVSSGIEPVFAFSYTRKILEKDGSHRFEVVEDYAVAKYREFCNENDFDYDPDNLPEYFVSAQTLEPSAHVKMQAVAQTWIDSSISKTINVPEDISYDDFKDVYLEAYSRGCKGCTTYRPNEITGSVLSVEPKKETAPEPVAIEVPTLPLEELRKRPEALEGKTYKVKFGDSEHAIYVTVTDIVDPDGTVKPFEIFINSKNMDHFVWTVGLTRMISAIFRVSNDSRFVVEELKAVFDPKGGAWMKGQYVNSILAAIGQIIEEHMYSIGYMQKDTTIVPAPNDDHIDAIGHMVKRPTHFCPKCHGTDFKKESGCEICMSCGHSKCG